MLFTLNGDTWGVVMVDGGSDALIDRTGTRRLATTDPATMAVYLSRELEGSMLARVLVHEMGHCAMHSYGLIGELHRMVKRRYWREAEEWCCNLLADYGMTILDRASRVIGGYAIECVPSALSALIA